MTTSSGPASGVSHPHESARAQVAGAATYVDDIPEIKGTLHAAPILSTVAHGRLLGIDAAAALAMPGVRGAVLAGDIPGDPVLATFVHDEPVFARDKVEHVGQVVGVVVADTVMQARRAARKVQLKIAPLPPVLSPRDAHARQSYVLPPVTVRRGEPEAALARSQHTLDGQLEVGGQEHFYLEGQVAYALPLEQDQWWIHSSTQHPGEIQHWVAHALGLENNAVTVECRRMGGGFGGKETQAGHMAVWAALAARKFRCPVKLRLDRDDDFMITGKRHPFAYDWRVGFDASGLVTGLKLTMLADCGFSADLSGPVADRALFHTDNAYFLGDVEIASYRCKTNTQSHTAFRGFGGPQGVIVIEAILGDVARHLGLDPFDVRMRNLYGVEDRNVTHYRMKVEDNILHPLMAQLEQTSRYRQRRAAIAAWNATSPVIKRGIAITPVKFGISFTATFFNQAGALVHVYTDGSVQVNHGGTEMGQGLNTKVAQIVADELGVPFERVRSTAADTSKVPNASATAASSGTDLNGRAAQFAACNVRDNLASFVSGLDGCGAGAVRFRGGQVISPKATRSFDEVVKAAYANRIQLWSDGFYRTPKIHYDKTTLTGRPFYYFSYGGGLQRSGDRHPDGREPGSESRHPARRRHEHQSGHRYRPDRRRLHPGRGLAHDRAAGVERQGPPRDPRPQHLQDPGHRRCAGAFQDRPLARSQPRGQRRRQQGRRRAAADAGDQRVGGIAGGRRIGTIQRASDRLNGSESGCDWRRRLPPRTCSRQSGLRTPNAAARIHSRPCHGARSPVPKDS